MAIDENEINIVTAAVIEKLRKGGISSYMSRGGLTSQLNAVASAIAARLAAGGADPRQAPQQRFVSDGMRRLASAVSYKLAKAEDPKTASFNKVASDVAKTLYEAKQNLKTGAGGQEPVGVHSSVSASGL